MQIKSEALFLTIIWRIYFYGIKTLRKPFTTDQLDTYWENLVLALIGETIDVGDEICGCRVVDKSSKKGRIVQMCLINDLAENITPLL